MIPVQHTQIVLLKSKFQLAENTSEVPVKLNYTRTIISAVLLFLLQLAYIGGLLFLAIRTKSKGITLFFLIEAIGKLIRVMTGLLSVYLISKSLSSGVEQVSDFTYPLVMEFLNFAQSFIYLGLYLLGIYILYKEYKVGKLIPPDKLDKE